MTNCEQLEIDTKDICLLCLETQMNTNFSISVPQINPTSSSLQGLKHLLRYLKVSPKELFNCSTEFLQSMEIREDINLKINLCSGCSSVTEKFNKLYQDYELIQLQFGNCVQSLHESMSKGNENPERVRKYKDQMRPSKSADLVNASIAANLRNETLKKCTLKLQSGTPKVSLLKPSVDRQSSELSPDNFTKSNVPKKPPHRRSSRSQSHDQNFGISPLKSGTNGASQVSPQNPTVTKPLLLPIGGDKPDKSSSSRKLKTKVPNSKSLSKRDTRSKMAPVPDEMFSIVLPSPPTQAPPKVDNTNRFNAIKKKIKNKTKPTALIRDRRPLDASLSCDYCKSKFKATKSLKAHKFMKHAEHIIRIYVSPIASLASCKQGLDTVWEQIYKKHGSNCQFCKVKLADKTAARRHVIRSHTDQIAGKVREYLDSLSNAAEPSSPDASVDKTNPSKIDQQKKDVKSPRKPLKPKVKEVPVKEPESIPDVSGQFPYNCDSCEWGFQTTERLNFHKIGTHPEQFIAKFLPVGISLEACKEGTSAVWKWTCEYSRNEAGYRCGFCKHETIKKSGFFKRHVITCHLRQFADEVQQYLKSLSNKEPPKTPSEAVRSRITSSINATIAAIEPTKRVAPKNQKTQKKKQSKITTLLSGNAKKLGKKGSVSKNPGTIKPSVVANPDLNSPKKILKTSTPTGGKTPSADSVRRVRFGVSCEHCKGTYMAEKSLEVHKILKHTEHIVAKLLPGHVSLEACKQGSVAVLKAMCEQEHSEFGYECEFCNLLIRGKFVNLKRHVISIHERNFATKVYQHLAVLDVTEPTNVETVAAGVVANNSDNPQEPVAGTSTGTLEAPARKNTYRCRFCDYATGFSSALKYHSLERHPTDNVMDHVPPNVSKVECDSVVHSVLNRIIKPDGICFKCGIMFTKLRRHVLVHHFDDFLGEVKKGLGYLAVVHSQGGSEVCNGNMEQGVDQVEIELTAEVEFEEERMVKVEVEKQSELIDVDPLVDVLD